MERQYSHPSVEQARKAAIEWLAARGVEFGPYRNIEVGRLGVFAGREVGVSWFESTHWRLRIDYDPGKGPHFNAEFGKGVAREKAAFLFPGTEDAMKRLANNHVVR